MPKATSLEIIRVNSNIFEHIERGEAYLLSCTGYEDWNREEQKAIFAREEARSIANWIISIAPYHFVVIEQTTNTTGYRGETEGYIHIFLVSASYWNAHKKRLLRLDEERAAFDDLLDDTKVDL